jgi:transposase-like protein
MASAMRSRASIQELASYFGVSRPTIHAWLRKYNEANKEKYDPKNIKSVFRFFEFLQTRYYPNSSRKARRAGFRNESRETIGNALIRLSRLGERLQLKAPPDLSARIDEILYGDG